MENNQFEKKGWTPDRIGNLNDKTYVITGTTSGTGFEAAKILVADDVALNRQLVKDLLEGTDFVLKEAENGEQAMAIAQQWQPDLILMDIRMPVMDGYEATSQMKQREDTQHIPIVALTASVMSKDEHKIKAAGFDGYLKKPVSSSELYAGMADFLPHTIVNSHSSDKPQNTSEKLSAERTYSNDDSSSENILLSYDKNTRRDIRAQFLVQWEQVNGSGDIAAIIAFADALHASSIEKELVSLTAYASALKVAAEAFDLDEVQYLLGSFEERVVE